ncbi:ABC-type transport auxiliary lipoprotein family protein [Aromatoleum toluclasticum]|uniref:ABC-type transport auxiliary lipoprotein family protein n=1 Tax=Aromatoleum toluclasticum TaxID=92003 RepID=UPI0003738DF7|nr:ABC-type transport auxiliary lipoprotein family protein [Aromatoleum toluclasticum]
MTKLCRSARRGGAGPRCAVVLSAALLLSACSVLPKAEPVDTYLLPGAPAHAAADGKPLAVSLRVAKPASGVHLSGQRIVVMPQDNQVSVYQGASWSEPAPVLVRDRLIDALRADGRIAALSSDEARLQADYEIVSDLRAFQSEYRGGAPEAVVRLDARLVEREGRRILANRTFEAGVRASGADVPAVVSAFGAASTHVATELATWAVDEIRRVPPRQ